MKYLFLLLVLFSCKKENKSCGSYLILRNFNQIDPYYGSPIVPYRWIKINDVDHGSINGGGKVDTISVTVNSGSIKLSVKHPDTDSLPHFYNIHFNSQCEYQTFDIKF